VVAALQACLEIAQDGVDPKELGDVLGLAPVHDDGFVRAAGLRDGAEAGQPVGADRAARGEVALGPIRDRVQGKSRYWVELDAQRVSGLSVSETAATKGTLFSEPRPTLPPVRSPPR